jgi:HEAT repeat protein
MARSELCEVLRSDNRADRVGAIERLANRSTATDDELQALAACLAASDKLTQRRAAEAFAQLHHAGVDVDGRLREALRSPEAALRWGAAFALSLIGPLTAEVRPVLLENMGADDGDVRWAASDLLLRESSGPGDMEELRRLLLDGNANQRKMAAYCLRRFDQRSVELQAALMTALDDAEVGVRLAAIAALARLAVDQTTSADAIAELLEDADVGVRRSAAATLGQMNSVSSEAIAALRRAQAGDDESLRRAAASSLQRLSATRESDSR